MRDGTLTCYYRGDSMRGTFRLGDRLLIAPMSLGEIRLGDVVVFRATNQRDAADEIVHRVVAITSAGLVTQGDNNPCCDAFPVTADNLIGRVTRAERDGKTRSVRGGRIALARVWLARARRHVRRDAWQLITWSGYRVYRWLRDTRIVARLWHPAITQLTLTTEQGRVVKYVLHGRTIARWWQHTNRFECDKPYDLILSRPDPSGRRV
ncbi:MAG: signal peptidase I [Chloroflexi bacterium]|nr:signal peptidase I [Chloroflexota bacterium]